jgi:glutathione S-transferase
MLSHFMQEGSCSSLFKEGDILNAMSCTSGSWELLRHVNRIDVTKIISDAKDKDRTLHFFRPLPPGDGTGTLKAALPQREVVQPAAGANVEAVPGAKPNTLYVHPVSGNALGPMLYIKEKGLPINIEVVDILKGEQMQPWFVSLNPNHAIPTLCDANGNGVWESGAILRHLAKLKGDRVSDTTNVALDWRQSTCYQHFAQIYAPHLGFGGDASTIPTGIKGLKEKMEPVLIKRFLWRQNKFIGGPQPSIADYSLVPCLTMLTSSPYWDEAHPRIKQYVADFQAHVKCWQSVAKDQTNFVASKQVKQAAVQPQSSTREVKQAAVQPQSSTRDVQMPVGATTTIQGGASDTVSELEVCLSQVQSALTALQSNENRATALAHCQSAKATLLALRQQVK